jgi:hypothetical protein
MYCTLHAVGSGDSPCVQTLLKLLHAPFGCTNAHIADWMSLDVMVVPVHDPVEDACFPKMLPMLFKIQATWFRFDGWPTFRAKRGLYITDVYENIAALG